MVWTPRSSVTGSPARPSARLPMLSSKRCMTPPRPFDPGRSLTLKWLTFSKFCSRSGRPHRKQHHVPACVLRECWTAVQPHNHVPVSEVVSGTGAQPVTRWNGENADLAVIALAIESKAVQVQEYCPLDRVHRRSEMVYPPTQSS